MVFAAAAPCLMNSNKKNVKKYNGKSNFKRQKLCKKLEYVLRVRKFT